MMTSRPVSTRPEIVLCSQSVVDRSIKVEYEVRYCEFVYAVSAIFLGLLPVSAYALVRRSLAPIW